MTDRRVPYDGDAERALVGACILDPAIVPRLEVKPHHLHGPLERKLLRGVLRLISAGTAPEPVTLADAIGEQAITPSTVTKLLTESVGSANYRHYEAIVLRHALTRKVLDVAASVSSAYARKGLEGDDLLSEALRSLAVIDRQVGQPLRIAEVIREELEEMDRRAAAVSSGLPVESGITTGLPRLDALLGGGWRQGVFHLLAGRPGMGKSAVLMAFGSAAAKAGIPTHSVSLEDSRGAYARRLLALEGKTALLPLRTGNLDPTAVRAVTRAAARLVGLDCWIYTDSRSLRGRTWLHVRDEVAAHQRANGTKVLFLDYLQIVAPSRWVPSSVDRLDEVVNGLADLAADLDIAVVCGAQLNREVEKRDDKRPRLHDIRGSGVVEQRSKAVLAVYRGRHYSPRPVEGIDYPTGSEPPSQSDFDSSVHLIVLKQNEGPCGVVPCRWVGEQAAVRPWDEPLSGQREMDL